MTETVTRPRPKTRSGYRPCTTPGCPELVMGGGPCPTHDREQRAAADAIRGTFRERGYDNEYDRNRATVIREETHCWLCHKPVDKTLPGTHPDGPTADHVTQRADGGTNARDNLRLAHAHCNAGRRPNPKGRGTPTSPDTQGPWGSASRGEYESGASYGSEGLR